jgi:hypothetical protein
MDKGVASFMEVLPKNMKYYNIKLEVMLRMLARNKKSAKAQAKASFNNINWVYMKELD